MNEFLEEINQQPVALAETVDHLTRRGQAEDILGREWLEAEQVLFSGMGSSLFAAFPALYYMYAAGDRGFALDASELLHYQLSFFRKQDQVMLVSQSGESAETVRLSTALRGRVSRVLALTNEPHSTLARNADGVLLTRAGTERMTSSKTYVSTLAALYTAAAFRRDLTSAQIRDWLAPQADKLSRLLSDAARIVDPVIAYLGVPSHIELIGRGPDMATARQGALVFKEASGILTEAMAGGEFRHGPLEVVGSGFSAMIFAPSASPTYRLCADLSSDIISCGGKVVFVTSRGGALQNSSACSVELEHGDCWSSVFLDIQLINIMAVELAQRKGFQAGSFSHGAKITSRE